MRICLMFGVIVSAAFYMPHSRAYAEFHAYLIDFVQGAAVWASVAVIARAAWCARLVRAFLVEIVRVSRESLGSSKEVETQCARRQRGHRGVAINVETAIERKKPHSSQVVNSDVNLADALDACDFAQSFKRDKFLYIGKHESVHGYSDSSVRTNECDEPCLAQGQLIEQSNKCQVAVVHTA